MSSAAVRASGRRGFAPAATPLALMILGSGALLLRIRVLTLADSDRTLLLAVIYTALLIPAILVPAARGERASIHRRALALAVGVVGIVAARLIGGTPVPIPFGPWALPLSVFAAIAEEAFFRRACYGMVRRQGGPAPAIVVTALVFAAIHVPAYGVAVFPLDLGAGILLGWQRWETGTWTVPAATHVAANLMAVIAR